MIQRGFRVLLVPGIFLFSCLSATGGGASLALAEDLYAEEQWSLALAESLRAMREAPPEEQARAAIIAATSRLHLGRDRDAAKESLWQLSQENTVPEEVRHAAAYTYAVAEWEDGRNGPSLDAMLFIYTTTEEPELFWKSGYFLYRQYSADSNLREQNPSLWQSLQSCRETWPHPLIRAERERFDPKASSALLSFPGRWIVRFYRAQISPAIGLRCDAHPSCSEYFLQASKKHGLLGIPIMADRFVREPNVTASTKNIVVMPDGHLRHADPLSDHDYWMPQ